MVLCTEHEMCVAARVQAAFVLILRRHPSFSARGFALPSSRWSTSHQVVASPLSMASVLLCRQDVHGWAVERLSELGGHGSALIGLEQHGPLGSQTPRRPTERVP